MQELAEHAEIRTRRGHTVVEVIGTCITGRINVMVLMDGVAGVRVHIASNIVVPAVDRDITTLSDDWHSRYGRDGDVGVKMVWTLSFKFMDGGKR